MLVTKREIHLDNWRNHGPLTIPAGLKVSRVSYGQGSNRYIYFLEDFGKVFNAKTQPIQHHDAEYYGISIEESDVMEDSNA